MKYLFENNFLKYIIFSEMNLKLIALQVCDKCGRGFVTSSVLKEHAKLHSGTKKSFGCTTCGAKYASFADLKIHQRRYILHT